MIDYYRLQKKMALYCSRRGGHEVEIVKPVEVIPKKCLFLGFCKKCRNYGWLKFTKEEFRRLYKKVKGGEI